METLMLNYENIGTSCINDESTPWIPFLPYSDVAHLKYFTIDAVRGETVTLLKLPAGMSLPKHHHSGTVIVYTVSGSWKYLEHDWIARKGSIVYETAGTAHTPTAMPDGDDVITLNITQGELAFLDENDKVVAVENWRTSIERYLKHCRAAGITPRDLTSFGA
jgi:2,4'-dihydroxyacetophenone dioxygenase